MVVLARCTPMPTYVVEGGSCRYVNDAACESGRDRLLECREQHWVSVADCRGPEGCVSTPESTSCDTSRNTVGDRCPPASEGKVRCDPMGQRRIIRCTGGVFEVAIDCPEFTRCGLQGDAGLFCG